MLELIPSILIRFRENKAGVVSDIRKAFQMIGVDERDQQFQKFLWWQDYNKRTLKVYKHCRVVFGITSSPFVLAAVLEYHLSQVPEDDHSTAELLKKFLYVDNCVGSLQSFEQVREFQKKARSIMSRAQMDLCQWEFTGDNSNSPDQKETVVLGVKWDKSNDSMSWVIPSNCSGENVTKRSVLSAVSQVYDPIGVLCPVMLQPKLQLQQSWTREVGWDVEWRKEDRVLFLVWLKQLSCLEKIKIPRWVFPCGDSEFQLHTFCDASQSAYAAVVYVRVKSGDQVSVQLLQAKSRLIPLAKKDKKITINRLELMSCLIAARLVSTVQESLTKRTFTTHMWSDSTNALAWISRDEHWGTFVGNRVREINRLTKSQTWRHVPGFMNPADLPSRGCSPSELLESYWWEGPSWLKGPEESWPSFDEEPDETIVNQERKKEAVVTTTVVAVLTPVFSSYLKNVRLAGWIRRFVSNCKKKKQDRIISPYLLMVELRQGEKDLLYQVQRCHFQKKPELKGLDVTLQEDKLYHVKTRLIYKKDSELFRTPILLPKDDPLVRLLIEYIHKSSCHSGTQFVVGQLRERYWIPSARKTVGKILHKCVKCKRYSRKLQGCDMAPLPEGRMEADYAFQTTGVDLVGPITLKGGKKTWIVLYTCAVYRGVYLDLVDSLSTDEFLDSLEKFTWIIGRPYQIYSDNGTNFVGAHNLMKQLKWDTIEKKLDVKKIKWTFNPPTAAWWGGFWERLVRTVKELLRKMLGTAKLTRKELEKCLAEVSHTINDRPLTTITEDGNDLISLTPNMFMKCLPVSGLPEREFIKGLDLQESHQKLKAMKEALKKRFRKEYLANIVQRKNEKDIEFEVGDIILVGADNKKRYEWPLGRILELIPGKDGKVRVARIRTSNGVLTRPLQRLYPLEVSSSDPAVKEITSRTKIKYVPPEEESVKTRSGRLVKKPSRYDQWNN